MDGMTHYANDVAVYCITSRSDQEASDQNVDLQFLSLFHCWLLHEMQREEQDMANKNLHELNFLWLNHNLTVVSLYSLARGSYLSNYRYELHAQNQTLKPCLGLLRNNYHKTRILLGQVRCRWCQWQNGFWTQFILRSLQESPWLTLGWNLSHPCFTPRSMQHNASITQKLEIK